MCIRDRETGNAELVTREGAGDLTLEPLEVLEALGDWLTDGRRVYHQRAANAHRLGRPTAAFDAGSIFTGSVFSSMVLRPDGRILCGGSFSVVQGQARPGLVQLLPNGSVDPAFTVGAGCLLYTSRCV